MKVVGIGTLLFVALLALARAQDDPDDIVEVQGNDVEDQINDDNNEVEEEEEELDTEGLSEVHTPVGKIFGSLMNDSDVRHYRFLGIPYARAPTGELRFRDPVPLNRLEDDHVGTEFGPSCPQIDPFFGSSSMDEDCLRLNVYTPRLPVRRDRAPVKSSLLPVMVWIHGGDFVMGNGNIHPEPLLAKDVVVVSMNYRLGALGFMSLGNSLVPGNMGLKDQLEALKWVQRNIQFFGGDPTQVTLFGDSGVHYHQLSPQGQGLYRAGIAQSGVATTKPEHMLNDLTLQDSIRLVSELDCEHPNVVEMFQCLQTVGVDEILNKTLYNYDFKDALAKEKNGSASNYVFAPVVDRNSPNSFLPDYPINLVRQGRQKDIPMIMGSMENEGSLPLRMVWKFLDDLNTNWTDLGPRFLFSTRGDNVTPLDELNANVTRHFYTGTQELSQDLKEELLQLLGDGVTSGIYRTAKYSSETQNQPIFFYEITHKPSKTLADVVSPGESLDFGAGKGDDMMYLFSNVGNVTNAISTEDDKSTQEAITTMWTNFAKYFDPTPFHEEGVPTWAPFTSEEERYMEIKPEPEAKQDYHPVRMTFWRRFYWEDIEQEYANANPSSRPISAPLPPTRPAQPVVYGFRPPVSASGSGSGVGPSSDKQQPAALPYPFFTRTGQLFAQQFPNRHFA